MRFKFAIYGMVMVAPIVVPPEVAAQTLVRQAAADTTKHARESGAPCQDLQRPTLDAVYLDGALKGDDAKSASTATGSLGISTFQPTYSFAGQINIAAKTDTVREDYGTALLNPGSGKALKAGIVEWRRPINRFFSCKKLPKPFQAILRDDKVSLRAYGSVSRAEWSIPRAQPTADKLDTVVRVTPIGYGIGVAYSVRQTTVLDKSLAIGLTLGFAQRILKGDGAAVNFDAQRRTLLGTEKTSFSGVEAGLELQFGDVTGGITYYTFPRAATVPGFSRGQVIGGFAIKANVLDKKGGTT